MKKQQDTSKKISKKAPSKLKKDRVSKELETVLLMRDSYRPLGFLRKSLFNEEETVLSVY